jgi:hypothetical protein
LSTESTIAAAPATSSRDAPLVEVPDDVEKINDLFYERHWGDGLPIIPPTKERVSRMIAGSGRDAAEVIGVIPPGLGAATVERIAINAVMAGCLPSYMPVLIAAVDAITTKGFNIQGIQCTTNPVAVFVIVNGPIAQRIGMNGGINCLGQGNRANVTIGRALHLVMSNVGACYPGIMDRSTQGQPGKIAFCCCENEAENPWEPLQVEHGHSRDTSMVTVVAASGTHNLNTHAKDADDIIKVVADSMAFPPSNDYWIGGFPWIVFGPEHAAILKEGGLSKADVKRRLWEASKLSARRMAAKEMLRIVHTRKAELGEITLDTMLPISHKPENIGILVAGGPGTQSVYVQSFGDTMTATRVVR